MTPVSTRRRTCCSFVPPHIINHMARRDAIGSADPTAAQRTALADKLLRDHRAVPLGDAAVTAALAAVSTPQAGKSQRAVYDDQNTMQFDVQLVRGEGDPAVEATNVNKAYDNAGYTRDYFREVHGRESLDNQGMTIVVNVNFGEKYNNAFYDGSRLVLGNGDGEIFVDFSGSPDVMGHEFGHGVVDHTAKLEYQGQSGALNESFADVFGSLMEQRVNGQDFASANWLIGDEIMAPALYGEALRSMAHPGTAYDNSKLGKDPQPAHMNDYYSGPGDNQGVHINSGIPNRAFYLVASELGTENAGRIWYAGLQNLWPTAVFTDAAAVLSAQARILAREGKVDRQAAQSVRGAFREVGVA